MLMRFCSVAFVISLLSRANIYSLQAQTATPLAGPVIAVLDVGAIRRDAASVK